jgi:hypothetical protein
VLAAASDLIHPDQLLILLSGDASRVRDEVADGGFGPVEVVTAEAAAP